MTMKFEFVQTFESFVFTKQQSVLIDSVQFRGLATPEVFNENKT